MKEYIFSRPEEADDTVKRDANYRGELIRCRDCKHRYNGKDDSPCELLNMPLGLSEDFYCMFAERK